MSNRVDVVSHRNRSGAAVSLRADGTAVCLHSLKNSQDAQIRMGSPQAWRTGTSSHAVAVHDSVQLDTKLKGKQLLPQPSDHIRVNVVARPSKTSTCVMLARHILQRDPESRIAYIVFSGSRSRDHCTFPGCACCHKSQLSSRYQQMTECADKWIRDWAIAIAWRLRQGAWMMPVVTL